MYQLWILGALDNTGALTQLGRGMVEFPLGTHIFCSLLRQLSEFVHNIAGVDTESTEKNKTNLRSHETISSFVSPCSQFEYLSPYR